ncbi:MAG: hydrogenase iron-sulfur subunit [Anaerolineales bacterium]|jgi:coenzyme F420-reducing hydrogenase delta subunit
MMMDAANTMDRETIPELPDDFSSSEKKVILFTCNWSAYSGLDSVGVEHLSYSAAAYPLKVICLGQLSPGIILKAFEKGADGVLLMGCPPGECHFEFGNRRAQEVYEGAQELLTLLGYREEQLMLDWVGAGEGKLFVEKVEQFMRGIYGNKEK